MQSDFDPLVDAPPAEVTLSEPPLVRVVAQVRFPLIMQFEQPDFLAGIQIQLRGDYPVLEEETVHEVLRSPEGRITSSEPRRIWRFKDATQTWRLSLSAGFLALETSSYATSRSDFLARFRRAALLLEPQVGATPVTRVGLRYVNRIIEPQLAEIGRLVRPEMLGVSAVPFAAAARHALSDALFPLHGGFLRARWGFLAPRDTIDPATIEPLEGPSWLLDMDTYSEATRPFAVDEVLNDLEGFARRIYAFFRWAVTDDFLTVFGRSDA